MADNEEQNPTPPPPPPPPPPGREPRDDEERPPRSPFRFFITWAIILAMIGWMAYSFSGVFAQARELENEGVFRKLVAEQRVEKVEIVRDNGGKTFVRGVCKDGGEAAEDGAVVPKNFTVNVMPDTEELQQFLRHNGVPMKVVYSSPFFGELLVQLIPIFIFLGLLWFLFYRNIMRGPGGMGAMNFGKSRAKLVDQNAVKKVLFKDVAGCAEAKEELQEIVAYLKDPGKFSRLGAKMPHGVLLAGPPGTGKTLLAKAIAGEAGVPFFAISGSDFVEMFVGVGASRVRDMFEQAKKNKPCLIFIDEIDAVGRSRFTGIGGGHDEREQTLNALLVGLDGFESNDGIVVIAATNRPDVLDPALLRPGRFDRQVVVSLPTMDDRLAILKVHADKVKLAPGTDLGKIARGTPGCSGADLANIVNEAAILASREEKDGIDEADFEEARDRVLWGRQNSARNKAMDEQEKRLTAYHESGHTVLTVLAGEDADPVHKVTIIPRGMALGATMFLPKKDKLSVTKKHLLADLVISMGGRVAEEIFMPDVTTGARQDLKQATALAHSMVCDWGFSEKLGPRTFGANQELLFLGREVSREQDYSERTAQLIDEEVSRLLREAYDKARTQIETHRDAVELMARTLLERETIDGSVAEMIVKEGRVPDPPAPPTAPASAAEPGQEPPAAPMPGPAAEAPSETPSSAPADDDEDGASDSQKP